MKKHILLNILFGVLAFLFIISFSIAVPIYCRFIHTLCIKPMDMVNSLNARTGGSYTFDDIVEAYNGVLNYCCFYTPWSCGKLLCPEEDVLHFEDCRKLFTLDAVVLLVTLIGLVVLLIIQKKKKERIFKPLTFLITGVLIIVLPIVLGAIIASDFDAAFTTFHSIFFPGKTNWVFNPNNNYIILIMPEEFFMVCAIVIGSFVIIGAGLMIALFFIKMSKIKKEKKQNLIK